MFLQEALKSLPQAAQNPFAFVAYLAVIIAWVIIAWRVKRNRNLLKKMQDFPEEQRRDVILAEMGSPVPPRLSAEEQLKARRQRYFLYAFIALCVAVVIVVVIALAKPTSRDIVLETLEQISAVPVSEYISLDSRLRELAEEQGKTPEQLKDEIDDWIERVKTPYEKGLAAFYRQKYQEAEDYLNQSIESSKRELAKKYFHRGNAQLANRKYDLAIASYKITLSINPNHDRAHNNIGIAYSSMGEYDLAIESCRTAICINPNLAQAYHNMGVAYYSMGKYDPAIDAYKEAINVVPNARSYNNLGNVYTRYPWKSRISATCQIALIPPRKPAET